MSNVDSSEPIVTVVIGTYNRLSFLVAAIDSLREEINRIPHEIIVVDGGSDDGTIEWLSEQKDIITIIQHNRGKFNGKQIERKSWGYFMNLGFKSASGKYICMLSDDCLVVPGAIKNGVKLFDKKLKRGHKIGGVAFYWRNWPEQSSYWVGFTYNETMHINHGLYLRSALANINYIDAASYSFYHADSDICLRLMEAGYSIIDSPNSFIEHFSDANAEVRASNLKTQKRDWKTYNERWSKYNTPKRDWFEKEFNDRWGTAKKYWSKINN